MKSITVKVEKEFCFYLKNGKEIYNVTELLADIYTMDDEVFDHHVTAANNDFANWINHIFENKTLAGKIKNAANRAKLIEVLEEALVQKETPVKKAKVSEKEVVSAKKAAPEKKKTVQKKK